MSTSYVEDLTDSVRIVRTMGLSEAEPSGVSDLEPTNGVGALAKGIVDRV